MSRLQLCVRIAAPVERLFEVFADLRSAPDRIKGIKQLEVLTDGPIGVGTKFRETREMFGKDATEAMEITEFDPPWTYSVSALSCGCHYTARYDFRSDGAETIVELAICGEAISFFAKLLMPVMGWLMSGSMKQSLQQDMDDLKAFIEHPA